MTYPPQGQFPGPGQPFGDPRGPRPGDAAVTRRSRRRLTVILAAIAAILTLVVGLGALKLYSDKTGNDLFPSLTLRSADDAGPDPFTSSVSLTRQNGPLTNRVQAASVQGTRVVNGTEPGLYAVNGSPACDTARLGNELSADPAAANAWADVIGIRPSDVPWYLNTLSPVILTADTWVTNHSYRSGVAHPFQSVLQAGTPVFVDGAGVPRAVCACGNPLRPPAAAPIGGYRVTGRPWSGYNSTTITRVSTVNQYVTNVNNTTTVVNNPAPAPLGPLQIANLVTRVLDVVTVGGTLNLPPAPADVVLPDPIQANQPVTFDDPAVASQQGLQAGSSDAAPEMARRAAENNDVPQLEVVSSESHAPETDDSTEQPGTPNPEVPTTAGPTELPPPANTDGPTTSVPAPGVTTTDVPTAEAPTTEVPAPEVPTTDVPTTTEATTTATPATTSAAPAATVFSGSGDVIGTLTFDSSGSSVTCTLPSTFDSSTVTATCSDGTSREFSASSLSQSSVSSATSNSVWSISTIGGETLIVTSAGWQESPSS